MPIISETTRQLRELLESGAAKYLFPLDVAYADLAVPADIHEAKYKQLSSAEMLPALLREAGLVAIYHTALHLAPEPSNKGSISVWDEKRIVAGFYDGRRNQFLTRRQDGGYDDAVVLVRVGRFAVLSHFLGELTLVAGETVVTFDLSFGQRSRGGAGGGHLYREGDRKVMPRPTVVRLLLAELSAEPQTPAQRLRQGHSCARRKICRASSFASVSVNR